MVEKAVSPRLGRVLATILVVVFVLLSFSSGMDRLSARAPGLERAVPAKLRANAARMASSLALLRGDTDAALSHAVQAVRHDPVDPHSVAVLASSLLESGQEQAAYNAFRTAALFGWRDLSTQAYWYNQALALKDWDVAMDRADAIMRTWPSAARTNDILAPFESDQDGRKTLLRHLAENPVWRAPYLQVTEATPSEVLDVRLAVLTQADSRDFRIGCQQTYYFVRGLLHRNRRADADAVLRAHCPEKAEIGVLADPTFERLEDDDADSPIGWIVNPRGDISVSRRGGDEGSLDMQSTATATRLVLRQPLALEPGAYHLVATFAEPARAGQLLHSVACSGNPPFPRRDEGDLSQGSAVIRVGACESPQLGLWLRPGGKAVRLKSLRIVPVSRAEDES